MTYRQWRSWVRMLWDEPMDPSDWQFIGLTTVPPEEAIRRIEEFMGPSPL